MNLSITDFYVFSQADTEGCCNLHRDSCRLAPAYDNRVFMGSPDHAWQYFHTHYPNSRAVFCLLCMKE
jgi:hypothetical protein